MYAILYWEDSTFSVIGLQTIISPRKETNEYAIGDSVRAKFQGKPYDATIYEINNDRSLLNKKLKTGMTINMQILEASDSVDPQPEMPEVEMATNETPHINLTTTTENIIKRRHKSTDSDLPKTGTSRKRRKTEPAQKSPEHPAIQEPLVEQAVKILLKRRSQQIPTEPTILKEKEPSPFMSLSSDADKPDPVPEFPLTAWPTATPFVDSSWTNMEPDNELGFMPTAPTMAQPVNDHSYTSLLSNTLEIGQMNSGSQNGCDNCARIISNLEQRIVDLESQMKLVQRRDLESVLSTPMHQNRAVRKPPQIHSPYVNSSPNREEPSLSGDVRASLSERLTEAVRYERRLPKAIATAMRQVFSTQQLANCSLKGGLTSKVDKRPSLPAAERDIVIDVISSQFGIERSKVECKMRSALRRFCLMFK